MNFGKTNYPTKSTLYQSPVRTVIVIALSIFGSEMIVMTILGFLQPSSSLFEMFLDSTLLVLLLLPIFYFFIFRPLVMFIAESKQAEDELRRSEEFNRAITQTAVEAIISINSEGNILSWNSAAKKIFGYSSSEMINKKLSRIIPSQHKTNHLAGVGRLKSGGNEKLIGKTIEITGLNKNGAEFPVELSLSSWETNNQKYYTGIIRDITKRKQAELLQSVVYQISETANSVKKIDVLYKKIHKILEQVLDVTNFYIAIYDDEENLLSFPFYKDSKDIFPGTARPLGKGLTEYVIRTGKPFILKRKDIEAYAKKGEIDVVGTLPEVWMGAPLITDNKVIGVIALNSYHDPNLYTKSDLKILNFVSEQIAKTIKYKQALTDLQVEKTYLNELFTSSPEALALVTTDSIILNINKHFTSLFGYSEKEVIGKNIDKLLVSPEQKKNAHKYTQEVASGKYLDLETVRKKKDGTMIHVSVLGSPVNYKGDILAVYGIYRDITERIKAAEDLAESNSMKELLLDIIAHDLRNPAGVIKGFAQFGLESDPNSEILDEINKGADNLLNIISATTTLSKVTIGDTIAKEELNLTNIINIIINENSSNLKYEDMTINMRLKRELIISANPIISEVFRNYITNAIQYAKNGKKIIIDANIEDGFVVVNVKDFGKTIEKKDRENIFVRNVQLDKTKGRGLGLGLAIVKRIAIAHDAEVGVKPNKPKGNNFYIKIPN